MECKTQKGQSKSQSNALETGTNLKLKVNTIDTKYKTQRCRYFLAMNQLNERLNNRD